MHRCIGAEVQRFGGAWTPMTKLKIHPSAPEKKRPAKMAGPMRLFGSKPPRGRLNCCMCTGGTRAAGAERHRWPVECGSGAAALLL